jgi:ectoine hydroxylase-related dioxygenase (phytanoyl-CoA dioxygenase family)
MTLREQFLRDGYIAVPRLIDAAALQPLREAFTALVEGEADCGDDRRMLGGRTRQVVRPSLHHPAFAANAALDAGRAIAAEVLACTSPLFVFDQLLHKPPLHPATTPWHQDLAYLHVPFTRAGARARMNALQFWVALDDVDAGTGCMHFLPGHSLDALLPHAVVGGAQDAADRLLAVEDAERCLPLADAVAVPLPAGGCTAHAPGTLHYTSANASPTRQRRAYIFSFAAT